MNKLLSTIFISVYSLSESLHKYEMRQGGRCRCSPSGFCFPRQNSGMAFWLSVTADSSPPKWKTETLSVQLRFGNMKNWFCWCWWNRRDEILHLIPLPFQPFRVKYLRITHFESLHLRMTQSFWIALVSPTPVVGGLPPDVMLKVLLSSICNPAQHSSGHRGETCLCVYVFIPLRRGNGRIRPTWRALRRCRWGKRRRAALNM